MDEVLVNVKVVAAILGVCEATIRTNPAKYRLKPQRTKGNHRRYRLKDVLELVKGK